MLRAILRGDPRRHEDLAALRVRAGTTNDHRRHPHSPDLEPSIPRITPLVPPRLDRNELGALLVTAGLGPPAEHALISLLALNGLRG